LLVRREDESSLRVQSHGSLLFVGHHEDAQEKEEAAGSLWKIVYPEPPKKHFFFIYLSYKDAGSYLGMTTATR
jgi:hypothetical protein